VVDVTVTNPGGTSATSSADQYTYLPAVTRVNPNAGPTAGSTSATLTGSGFTGATAVSFGTVAATNVVVVSDTQITATSPSHTAGTVDVTVTASGRTSATSPADQFSYDALPTVASVKPDNGATAGGAKVAISGTNYVSGATVAFGSTPATGVTFVSSKQLTAIVPAGSAGSVNVRVTTPGGTSAISSKNLYAYGPPTVTSFAPSSGITGSSVTVTGTAFAPGVVVMFGSFKSAKVSIVSGTQLKATVPNGDGTPGTISVMDAQGTGTSSTVFTPTFAITGFSPTSGPVGTVVTINGVGFTSSSVVKFHGATATAVTFVSANELQATVPSGATSGTITVTNTAAPVGTVTSATSFTVT
jgi:hypothetical protein